MKAVCFSTALGLLTIMAAFAPAVADERGPVLVWGVSAVTDIPEDQVDAVASWLPGEVERTTGMDVVAEDAIDEGIDLAMDNGECRENNMACVIEVARALWVSEAVYGDIGVVNGVYIITLRRVDATNGKVIKQVSAQTGAGVDVLIQSMSDMIATLYDIPHNQVGTVRALGSNDGYDYVIVTYGPWFSWIEPVVWYQHYPWWWSGPIHYYRHHHAWWGWHHRHPHGRPHYYGPRRPYPHRDHHAHHDGGHHDGDRNDGHDGGRDDDGRGGADRPSDDGREKGHRMDGDGKVDVKLGPRPNHDVRIDDRPKDGVDFDGRGSGRVTDPRGKPEPGREIMPPRDTVQKPQPQKQDIRKPQVKPRGQDPGVRPGNTGRGQNKVTSPAGGGNQPAVRGGSVGRQDDGKKRKSSGSGGSSKTSKPSGKSKSTGIRGPGAGGAGPKPAGNRGGH